MKQTIYKCDRCKKEINVLSRCGIIIFPKKIRLIDKLYGLYANFKTEEEHELCNDCYKKVLNFMKEHEDE